MSSSFHVSQVSRGQAFAILGAAAGGSGRGAGSAFKGITLATAIDQGLSVYSRFEDKNEMVFPGANAGADWTVSNYDEGEERVRDLVEATARSSNTVYAQLIQEVGPNRVQEMGNRLGVKADLPPEIPQKIWEYIESLEAHFRRDFVDLIEGNEIFISRTRNVGRMTQEQAVEMGVTGPALRCTGVDFDIRRDYPYSWYPNVDFDVITDDGPQPYIRGRTENPVREPFIAFLIEVRWSGGRLLREYTMLLDPPVHTPRETAPPPRMADTAPSVDQPAGQERPGTAPGRPAPRDRVAEAPLRATLPCYDPSPFPLPSGAS
jgi:hypothetical protein